MRRHFLFSLKTCERGKTACGRLGRQTSARTKTSAFLKMTFVDMTYPGQRPEPLSLSPQFLLTILVTVKGLARLIELGGAKIKCLINIFTMTKITKGNNYYLRQERLNVSMIKM